jgi:hypothetical protein
MRTAIPTRAGVRLVRPALYDFDRHRIPEHQGVPGHWHYDFRFIAEADSAEPLVISEESRDLRWVEIGQVPALTPAESVARLIRKMAGG